MNESELFERAGGYLNVQFRDPVAHPVAPRQPTPFVTISREAGSGGSALATVLTQKLNAAGINGRIWRVYEGDVTSRMLAANAMSRTVAQFLPEDSVPELSATIGELIGLHPNLWTLVQKTNEEIRDLAIHGYAILVGRGANFVTRDLPDGVHVRLVASEAFRARHFADKCGVPESHAFALNAKCDAARRRYVRAYFDADVTDPKHYDIVLNTEALSVEGAADLVMARIFALLPRSD
jgi:cytidylate kinase